MLRRIRMLSFLLAVVFASISATTARADEVTAWNQILFQATLVAQTSPLIMAAMQPSSRPLFSKPPTGSSVATH